VTTRGDDPPYPTVTTRGDDPPYPPLAVLGGPDRKNRDRIRPAQHGQKLRGDPCALDVFPWGDALPAEETPDPDGPYRPIRAEADYFRHQEATR
jgi:hypothetical protein